MNYSLSNVKSVDLIHALNNSYYYNKVLSRLEIKIRDPKFIRHTNIQKDKISLSWILINRHEFIREVIESINNQTYWPEPSYRVDLLLVSDKKREIYVQDWVDRIIQMSIAEILTVYLEPYLPDSVYSFRKKRSNHQAVRQFAKYIKDNNTKINPIYVIRRDIKNFALSISTDSIIKKWWELLGPQDEYMTKLIRCMIAPSYIDKLTGVKGQITKGVVPGSPLLPVCENLYLLDLDRRVSFFTQDFYARYGDDIIYATTSHEQANQIANILDQEVKLLELNFNLDKSLNCIFNFKENSMLISDNYQKKEAIDYLGININKNGEIFLPKYKIKSFKNNIRSISRRAHLVNLKLNVDLQTKILSIVTAINRSIDNYTSLPYFNILLMPEIDQRSLKKLDHWIAKQCLGPIFGSAHDRVFKKFSYTKLKKLGLKSLSNTIHKRIRAKNARKIKKSS